MIQNTSAGKATITTETQPNGNHTIKIRLKVAYGDIKSFMNSDEVFKADGTPIRSRIHQLVPRGEEQIFREYGPKEMVEKTTLNGKATSRRFPYPGGSRKQTSMQWFRKVRPKIGQKDLSWSFDGSTQKWKQKGPTYMGPRYLTASGKKVRGHFLSSEDSDSWVDDSGTLLRLELKGLSVNIRLERI